MRSSITKMFGVVLALALVTACTPNSRVQSAGVTPTNIDPKPSPTAEPSPTASPIPTATATAEPTATPQDASIKSDFAQGELTKACDASIKKSDERLKKIVDIPVQNKTVENTLLGMENTLADLNDELTPLTFMGYVSKVEALREEASSCEEKTSLYYIGVFTRKDLYGSLLVVKPQGADVEKLHSEFIKSFENNGLKLSDEVLAQVKDQKQKLASLETEFSANLNNDVSSVKFTKDELAGVSDSFLARLKKDEATGKYIVTTKSTDYVHVMENAKSPDTRKVMLLAYNNRAGEENTKLLQQAVKIRQNISKLMGFDTWADYRINGRMAKDAKTVLTFANGIKGKLAEKNKQDIAKLAELKKATTGSDEAIKAWDISYYSYQLKKKDFELDDEVIREYFPAEVVMKGMFEVYSKLLGVEYRKLNDLKVWSDDVSAYEVVDKSTQKVISYFYTDFVPREGKYGHAAAFTLRSGRMLPGGYNRPLSAIVANFTPPTANKPSLLTHDEVETIFHEFGHIMHQILTRAPYSSLSGTSVTQDFVEAPSQMLENWVWQAEILNMISGHYKDTTKKLPAELLKKMLAAKNFNQGYFYTRQLMLGLFDMTIHTAPGDVDVTKTYDTIYKGLLGVDALEGGHFAAGFGHMMGGYDAGYYGYIWSEVYAQDMFSIFEKEGILSDKIGAKYRKEILEKGGTIDPLKLVENFLGREVSFEAFYKKLGINN